MSRKSRKQAEVGGEPEADRGVSGGEGNMGTPGREAREGSGTGGKATQVGEETILDVQPEANTPQSTGEPPTQPLTPEQELKTLKADMVEMKLAMGKTMETVGAIATFLKQAKDQAETQNAQAAAMRPGASGVPTQGGGQPGAPIDLNSILQQAAPALISSMVAPQNPMAQQLMNSLMAQAMNNAALGAKLQEAIMTRALKQLGVDISNITFVPQQSLQPPAGGQSSQTSPPTPPAGATHEVPHE